jgi:hypothetical protein
MKVNLNTVHEVASYLGKVKLFCMGILGEIYRPQPGRGKNEVWLDHFTGRLQGDDETLMKREGSGIGSKYPGWFEFFFAGLFFTGTMAMIVFSPDKYIYDEGEYCKYATNLVEQGMGVAYVRELHAPPGPLHGIVHYSFGWATGFRPIPMRVVTNGIVLVVGLCASLLFWRVGRREAWYGTALLYGFPFAGVVIGVSLTESSAMLAATLATLFVVMGAQSLDCGNLTSGGKGRRQWGGYALVAMAGILYAAAVWGRQNYLVVLAALPLFFLSPGGFAWRPWVLMSLLMGSGSALLFIIWGGLVPEAVRSIADGGGTKNADGVVAGLNIIFGIRSLAYAALIFCLLAPGVFRRDYRLVFLSAGAAVMGCLIWEPMRFLPSAPLVSKMLGESFLVPVSILFGAGFSFLGFWLLASVFLNCRALLSTLHLNTIGKQMGLLERLGSIGLNKKLYLFGAAAWLLILASNMKIHHQFSSRYVVVAAPFLLITAIYHFQPTAGAIIRLICGYSVSMVLLANYYEWL